MMDCEHLKVYYEESALGVLEDEERAELAAHLARHCPLCTQGVGEGNFVVSQLAYLAPPAAPPEKLLRRILAAAKQEPGWRGWLPAWAWAGVAAAVLLVALIMAQQARRFQIQTLELEARVRELSSQVETYRRAFAIAAASGTRSISLTSAQPAAPQVRAYWNDASGLLLTALNIPTLAPERTYQLWVLPKQGNPSSAGIFRPDSTGNVLLISTPGVKMADSAALAITNEPAGGRPQPTTTPIWVGPLG